LKSEQQKQQHVPSTPSTIQHIDNPAHVHLLLEPDHDFFPVLRNNWRSKFNLCLPLTALSMTPAHWLALLSWKLTFLKASEGCDTSWVPLRQVVRHERG
jgi:hypothetical protein